MFYLSAILLPESTRATCRDPRILEVIAALCEDVSSHFSHHTGDNVYYRGDNSGWSHYYIYPEYNTKAQHEMRKFNKKNLIKSTSRAKREANITVLLSWLAVSNTILISLLINTSKGTRYKLSYCQNYKLQLSFANTCTLFHTGSAKI